MNRNIKTIFSYICFGFAAMLLLHIQSCGTPKDETPYRFKTYSEAKVAEYNDTYEDLEDLYELGGRWEVQAMTLDRLHQHRMERKYDTLISILQDIRDGRSAAGQIAP